MRVRGTKLAFGLLVAVGCQPSESSPIAARRAPIIGGRPAPERSEVVVVSHRDRADSCSGTLVAPVLTLTAKHCVFTRGFAEDAPLPADGFRIAFGPDDEHVELRAVDSVDWIGKPAATSVADAVAAGEDVAVLHLSEEAPQGTSPAAIDLDYEPKPGDELLLVGFGLSAIETGVHGQRLDAPVSPSGLDPMTGILQVDGPSACFGDSGGPVLLEPKDAVVGVIGQVGGSSDASFCDIDRSFAATAMNPRVREFLRAACELAGGCGPGGIPDDAGPDADAARQDAAIVREPAGDATRDAVSEAGRADGGARPGEGKAFVARGGCSLAAERRSGMWGLGWVVGLVLLRRRRRRSRSGGSGPAVEKARRLGVSVS